jgi:hypothetical protein
VAPADRWLTALEQAYKLAKAERLTELRGDRRPARFDERGLHVYSLLCGQCQAYEAVDDALQAVAIDPLLLSREARRDADREFRLELVEDAQDIFPRHGLKLVAA